ncbi:iron-sulfur cluster-binding protein [candidate division KSB1 bacterium]|nr:iron-sulfur cluster-binding protein [candidate division KSB1 bacterium]
MKIQSENFAKAAQKAIADADLQSAVSFGTNLAYTKRKSAVFVSGQDHGEQIRQQAAQIKRHALNNLPQLLEQAEQQMQKNGIKVLWAKDAAEANQKVLEIIQQKQAKKVIKSKSMVSEEIAMNDFLEKNGVQVIESDLGEYIIQISGDHPSHIVVPVVHRTKASIRDTLMQKIGMPHTDDAQTMTHFVRGHLRKEFLEADIGISGGNFIIAESGSLCLATNEGNGRMVTSLPPVHIAVVGIEKVIPTLEDYATLTQMLPRSATGQSMAVYTNIINGPRRKDEEDGPQEVYVVFLDNGRSEIYSSGYTEALACIRCGACLNACPVYRVSGGHSYGWVYPGPIGAVVTPLLVGLNKASPLPNASSLCGSCKQVCPVVIDIPRMLLDLRHDLTKQKKSSKTWKIGMYIWAKSNRSEKWYKMTGRLIKASRYLPISKLPGLLKNWTRFREMPQPAAKSFHDIWQDGLKDEDK